MAGQAVNLSGQINQLANSILQPATLSQTQQGLLGQLNQQVNPVAEVDMSSADGLRAGINDAIKRGDADRASMLQKVLTQKMGDDRAKEVAYSSADSRIAVAELNKERALSVEGMRDTRERLKAADAYIKQVMVEDRRDGRNTALIDGRRDIQEMMLVRDQAKAELDMERDLAKIDAKDESAVALVAKKHENALALIDQRAVKQIEVYKEQGKLKAAETANKALLQSRLRRIEKAEDVTKNDLEIIMGTIQADERFSDYMPTVKWHSFATDRMNDKQKGFAKRLAVETANYMRTANANLDPSDPAARPINESEALEVVLKRLSVRRAERAAAKKGAK